MSTQAIPAEIESVGHLSARVNVPVSRVMRTANGLGLHPTLIVDDVLHFNSTDAQRIVDTLRPTNKG